MDEKHEKNILLADADVNTLEELRQALGQQWKVTAVGSGAAALEALKKGAYDGIIASLCLPDLETAQLLNRVRSKHPKTVRFVVAAEKDRERVVKEVLGAHQFLIRPFDAYALRTTVERALVFDLWVDNDKLRKLAARMRTLPTMPALYLEIIAALKSADTTTEEVATLIAKDMAITTKLLQVINSPYFGLPRTVTSPQEAVGLLGFEIVKLMVMSIKLLNQYERTKMGEFSIERLWQHSTAVAHSARRLVLLQTGNRALAEEAFAAGLMHDVGKAVLAGNFSEQYQGAQSLARKREIPMWEVEKEIFGASHGEVGAYLLGLWGLPLNILEAAALHHQPARTASKGFTGLTAVHVANVLEHEAAASQFEGEVAPKLDMEYLTEIGMIECLRPWCEEILGPGATEGYLAPPESKATASVPQHQLASAPPPPSTVLSHKDAVEQDSCKVRNHQEQPGEPVRQHAFSENCELSNGALGGAGLPEASLTNDLPQGDSTSETRPEGASVNAESAQTLTLSEPAFDPHQTGVLTRVNRRLYVGAIAASIVVVGWFFIARQTPQTQEAVPVHAREGGPAPATGFTQPAVNPTTPPEKTGTMTTQQSGETNIAAGANLSIPSISPADSSPPTSIPEAQAAIPKERFPELRLQGILFSPRRPSAILNGVLVHPNDRLLGVRVVEIRSTSVTLEFQNQRKTLSLE